MTASPSLTTSTRRSVASSEKRGEEYVNLALLTDGLRAEREQGITIDVAYRYFATPKRKFIIADTPGHIQYTRNMVTGASTANLAIILIDARKGRHRADAAARDHRVAAAHPAHRRLRQQDGPGGLAARRRSRASGATSTTFTSRLDMQDVHFIPISALHGDNVVDRSQNMDWYEGPTLLSLLETVHIASDVNHADGRFPVQYVIRPQSTEYHDYRGYAGRIAGGVFRPGDAVTVLPSGFSSRVKSIDTFEGPLEEAFAPMSVTLTLEDEIDISRGDMIVAERRPADGLAGRGIDGLLAGREDACSSNGKYALKHTTRDVRCIVKAVQYKININTLERDRGRQDGRPERHRPDHPAHDPAAVLRPLPPQPRDGQPDPD